MGGVAREEVQNSVIYQCQCYLSHQIYVKLFFLVQLKNIKQSHYTQIKLVSYSLKPVCTCQLCLHTPYAINLASNVYTGYSMSIKCHHTVITLVLLSVQYSDSLTTVSSTVSNYYCGVELTSIPITVKTTVELLQCGNETTE